MMYPIRKFSYNNTDNIDENAPGVGSPPSSLLSVIEDSSPEVLQRKQDMADVMDLFKTNIQKNNQDENNLDDILLPTSILRQLDRKKLPEKYLNLFEDAIQEANYLDAYKIFLIIRHDSIVPRTFSFINFFTLLRESGNHKKCWELYDYLRSFLDDKKKAASLTVEKKNDIYIILQHIFSQAMHLCGMYEEAEKAMKMYRYYVEQQISMNASSYKALLYATSSRADFQTETFSILKQMESEGIEADIDVYNNLLKCCMKTNNLKMAHFIWNKLSVQPEGSLLAPTCRTIMHMFLLLAAIETPQTVNSRNKALFNISPEEIINESARIFRYAVDRKIKITEFLLNSFLAVHTNQRDLEKSLMIFYEFYPKYNLGKNPFTYSCMFRLFDSEGQYEKMKELLEIAKQDGVTYFDHMTWRSIIRICAAQSQIDEAIEFVKRMKADGHEPTIDHLKLLLLKIVEAERWDAREELIKLCAPIYHAAKLGKWPIWNERTQQVNKMLDDIYGRPAGKGMLRGVHANVKNRVPGPSFPYIQDSEANKFEELECESSEHQEWKYRDNLKKTPPPQKKILPLTQIPRHIPPAFPRKIED